MWSKKLFLLFASLFLLLLLVRLSGMESDTIQPMQRIKDLLQQNINERVYIKKLLLDAGIILQTSCGNETEIEKILNDLETRLKEKDKTIESLQAYCKQLETASSDQKTESEKQSQSSTEPVNNGWQTVSFVESGIIAILTTICLILFFNR